MVLLIYSSLTVIQKQSKTAFFFSICNNFLNITLDSFFFYQVYNKQAFQSGAVSLHAPGVGTGCLVSRFLFLALCAVVLPGSANCGHQICTHGHKSINTVRLTEPFQALKEVFKLPQALCLSHRALPDLKKHFLFGFLSNIWQVHFKDFAH